MAEAEKKFVRATPTIDKDVRKLARLRAKRSALEAEEKEIVARVKKTIGESDGIEGKGFIIKAKWGSSTSWKNVAMEAGASGDLIAKHTKKDATPSLTYDGAIFLKAKEPAAAAA